MVKLEWGTKRTCQGCSTRFYDLQKNPIVCPKCGVVFEPQATSRNRRSRLAVDTSKEITLDDNLLAGNLGLGEDLDVAIDDDDNLIEDTSELGEDLDDIPDILDHNSSSDQ